MTRPAVKTRAAALLPALLLLSGCLFSPALYKSGAFSIDDWDTWTSWNDAFGTHEISGAGLCYSLGANQDDTHDLPSGGRSPGLILSKGLTGGSWRAEVSPEFKVPAGGLKRFSFGVWLGGDAARPSLGSASAALTLLVQRQNGPGQDYDALLVSAPPAKNSPVNIPKETKTLRFERSGEAFAVSYSLDSKAFRQALRVESAAAAGAESQKFFVSRMSEGGPGGASAKFTSLKINGKETLR
ncbi:MAG TPA: hypothetical protein PKI19_12710 [Elusimicrobiales bacterium]|nr:hypothetical protein [Elusimicrobiales bacterium]